MENKNINVLIIEDNPADIKLASIMLKEDVSQRFTVKSSGLIEEGLKFLKQEKFDVVLLDINLPDNYALSGLEKISSLFPGTPVILLTGLDDETMASNALQKNAADYLIKGQLNTNLLIRSIRYAMERNKKEKELHMLNRTHHALSEISKAMILTREEPAFLKNVCSIIVNDCGYSMVWIAYGEEDEAKTISPMAYAGSEDGYIKTLNLTWSNTERGRGPTGVAIRTGKVCICPDMLSNTAFKPWREEAMKRGYASSISLPMNIGGRAFGALTIYSKETNPFSEDEVKLLSELAGYIAFGIMAIRSRTTQLKAEEALKASEQNYRDLIETANSIIIRWNTGDGLISYINDFGLKFFGYQRDEIVGKSVMNIVPKSDSSTGADLSRLAEEVAGDPEKFKYSENENIKKNGERAWVIWANKAVKDRGGKLKEILCIGNDISRLKTSENILRYQAEILEAVSDAVIATDLSFNITSWNKRAELMYGWKAEEALGKPIKDVVRSDMSDVQRAAIYNKVREGKAVPVEAAQYAKDGSKMISECYSMPIRDSSGAIKGYVTVNRNITERKRVEETLRESMERLDLALVSSRMATFDLDIVSNKRVWSDGVHSLMGTNPETFTGKAEEFFRIIHPEDRSSVQAALEKAMETGMYETEYRVVWPDRSIHHIAARGKVHYDTEGKAIQMTGVCWDITGRKRAEEALRESEKRFHELFDNMEEGFCVIQMIFDAAARPVDYRFLEINAAFERQTGLHGARGKLMRTLAPDHEERWFEIYGKIAMTGESLRFTNEAKALGFYYDVSAYRVGRPEERQVAVIFNDISWHKKAEIALKESEEKFRLLSENLPDLIMRSDTNLRTLYANQAVLKRTGLPLESLIGKTAAEYGTLPKAAEQWEKAAREVIESGEMRRYEHTNLWRGQPRSFDVQIVPERSYDGAVQSIIAIAHDITERKKAEEILKRDKDTIEKLVVTRTQELLNAQVELERSRRLSDIGTLAATVAHELRNPLGVIRTAVYNIKRKSQNNNLDSHIVNIEKKISESNQIINNLLEYARIKVPVFEKTQIYSILEECIDFEKEKFEKMNISFNKNIENIIDIYMEADQVQLKEVFNNILDNACQAMDKAPGRINVSAALDGKKNVIISIEDNGAGIEPEDINRLFEPFFTRKSKGTGLGLTICNQLINLHNGKIDIESSPGKGTIVTLSLPLGEG